jgi:hypothetical protein
MGFLNDIIRLFQQESLQAKAVRKTDPGPQKTARERAQEGRLRGGRIPDQDCDSWDD